MTSVIITLIELLLAIILGLAILLKPYLGLVFILASQSITDLLPKVSFVSSVVPLLGAVTLVGLLIRLKNENLKIAFKFSSAHLISFLFILWIFISNPTAAISGPNRNWVFTYAQLWILMWLAGFLLDTPNKHRTLMWIFSIFTLFTAIVAISQGGFLDEIDPTVRAAGLIQGANTAARYFIVTFVFLSYLRSVAINNLLRLLAIMGMIITFLGVFYTVSRTGMLLLGVALILLIVLQKNLKHRVQVSIISLVAIGVLLFFSGSILDFIKGISPAISEGTDTVGIRYAFWKAGLEMWRDHPIVGVGIGMFPSYLKFYPNPSYLAVFLKGSVAHNMYISMLAETGIIGFLLFFALLFRTLWNFQKSRSIVNPEYKPIVNAWLIVFIILLLGGITKTDQADKILWLSMGSSIFFSNQLRINVTMVKTGISARPLNSKNCQQIQQ